MQTSINQYLNEAEEFPYCSGCGHTWINKQLAQAFANLELNPRKINLISDIGCVGLVDKLFLTNTIHTTHGRSTAYATGMQLADKILFDNDAVHVIMIGDGGATIGLLHLVEAAKLNTNITVILHNNFVYGMTGGQNSGLTPENFKTATSLDGNLSPNIHIAKVLEAAHAGYISRALATDKDLDKTIQKAIEYQGFSLVEVVELCTGYATKWNSMSKADIEQILEHSDQEERGTIVESSRGSYANLYQKQFPKRIGKKHPRLIEIDETIDLDFSLIIAGSAGEGVQFAAKTFAETMLRHGLNTMQKNDNPVTIGTGFSYSELKFSTDDIYYSAIDKPDYILISSEDGLKRAKKLIESLEESCTIIHDSSIKIESVKLQLYSYDFRNSVKSKKDTNFMMIGALMQLEKKISLEKLEISLQARGKNSEAILDTVKKGLSLELTKTNQLKG